MVFCALSTTEGGGEQLVPLLRGCHHSVTKTRMHVDYAHAEFTGRLHPFEKHLSTTKEMSADPNEKVKSDNCVIPELSLMELLNTTTLILVQSRDKWAERHASYGGVTRIYPIACTCSWAPYLAPSLRSPGVAAGCHLNAFFVLFFFTFLPEIPSMRSSMIPASRAEYLWGDTVSSRRRGRYSSHSGGRTDVWSLVSAVK